MISLVGRTIGEYQLELPLGAGSMGEVFRARHVRSGAAAAVKVMHARLAADPGFRERFKEVAGAAARLRHPNVVTVLDVGEQGGQFYIVMELLTAGSLRALLQHAGRPIALARGVELMRQAAEGVHAGHLSGIVHRDVKPENLLLAADGADVTVRVADFGLTKLAETGLTLGGNVFFGSPAYMSPEMCKGSPLDARSDVYSLGVVLYEVATGLPPFQVAVLGDAVQKHISTPPPAPRSVAPDLPERLEAVILRCLAKRPEDRYATAADLAVALGAVLRELPAGPKVPEVVWRGSAAAARAAVAPTPSPPAVPPPAAPPGAARPPAQPPARRFKVTMDDGPAAPPAPPAPTAPAGGAPDASPPQDRKRIRVPVGEGGPAGPAGGAPASPPAAPAPPAPRRGKGADSRRIRVVLDADTLVLAPGQPAVVRVTLVNGGRTVDHYTLTVEGVPERWVQGPAAAPQLNPGERATVAITVLVPRAPESVAREYPVSVRARSRENPEESSAAPARWTVLPFAGTTLALAPARARGWRRARYAVTLRNTGNDSAAYALSGTDDEQRLRYEFAEPALRLGPGESSTVALRTRAPLRWIGGAEPRAFTVRAEPEAGDAPVAAPAAPQAAPGQFVHRALVPAWLPPLLLLALVAALFLLRGRNQIAVAVLPARVQVAVGASTALSATVTDAKNEALPDQSVAWTSRDTAVATVSDSGVVRGLAVGTTLVRAQRGKKSATAEVEVVPARVAALAVAPRRVTLRVGTSARLRATARDAGGGVVARDVTWQSSDPTVATVGGDGRVTAKAGGSATITVMSEGKSATAEIAVPAPPPEPVPGAVAAGGGAGAAEDCVEYDPAALRVGRDPAAGFLLSDGSATLATLDNESDARKALALARRYKSHCFLGRLNTRPNRSDYVVEHWKGPSGATSVIDAEDCVPYDRASLRVAEVGAQGFVLADARQRLLLADTKEDARRAWEIAQRHDAQCFIGRGNRRPNQRDYIVQYWR